MHLIPKNIASYNTEQAAVASIYHKNECFENKALPKEQFDRKIFGRNVRRLRALRENSGLQEVKSEINSILNWDSKPRSAIALLLYIGFVYIFQPWMMICAILLLFLRNSKTKPVNSSLDENRNTIDEYDSEEEDFSSDEIEDHELESNAAEIKEKVTIRAKLKGFLRVALKVQQFMGTVSHWGECFKNLIEFKVPFLSWIVVCLLMFGCFVLYFIPFRYLVMVGGANKILKRLIRPNSESSLKRFLNFVSKVPDDEELQEWHNVKVTKCREVLHETPLKKEAKSRFSRDLFTKKRKNNNPSIVPLDKMINHEEDIKEEFESDSQSDDEKCDNNEKSEHLLYETASSEDEVDMIGTCTDVIADPIEIASNGMLRSRNENYSHQSLEPEIQLSKRSLNFAPRTENKRGKDISVLTKEISNEISRKGIVIRDKIVARSKLASKGSKEDHSDDNSDQTNDPERTLDQIPRQRKRDILLAKLKEKTNIKD